MTLTIDFPDEQTAALAAKVQAYGMSAEEYARRVLADDLALVSPQPEPWETIVGNMRHVPAEDLISPNCRATVPRRSTITPTV